MTDDLPVAVEQRRAGRAGLDAAVIEGGYPGVDGVGEGIVIDGDFLDVFPGMPNRHRARWNAFFDRPAGEDHVVVFGDRLREFEQGEVADAAPGGDDRRARDGMGCRRIGGVGAGVALIVEIEAPVDGLADGRATAMPGREYIRRSVLFDVVEQHAATSLAALDNPHGGFAGIRVAVAFGAGHVDAARQRARGIIPTGGRLAGGGTQRHRSRRGRQRDRRQARIEEGMHFVGDRLARLRLHRARRCSHHPHN